MGIGTSIRFKGQIMKLAGKGLAVGDVAPDFTGLVGLSKISLSDTAGKIRLFSSVPSLDTPVCRLQTKRLNEEFAKLGDKVAGYTFSLDLPFAQQRFCNQESIENLTVVSDAYNRSFGANYGALLEGLPIPLLTRALFVVDEKDVVRHVEYVEELTEEPDYEKALAAIKSIC